MDRRLFLRVAATGPGWRILRAATLAGALCVGCTERDAPPSAAEDRIRIVAAIDADPGHLNPAITTGGGIHTASELLYNGLVELSPDDLTPVPELAVRWDVEDDGRLYRFHLRRDVRWHDGSPFTSADVVFTFESLLLLFHSRTRASLGSANPAIAALDEHTVEFRFASPYAPLLQQLGVTEAPILPRHVYDHADPLSNPANLAPVGTGPFRFVALRPDEEIRYAANRDYFKPGLPLVDEVVFRVIPDPGGQVIALEAGEVDWLFAVPGPDQARIEADDNIGVLKSSVNPGGANCITTIAFNLEDQRLRDRRLRLAIWHAIDRAAFLERVLFGAGRVATAPISSGIPFAHATDLALPAFDPERASALLDELGWRGNGTGTRTASGVDGVEDGTPLRIRFHHFPSMSPYGELLRAQLGGVGIDVELVTLEPPVMVDVVFRERAFETAAVSYCNGTDPEIGVRRQYDSSMIGPVPFSNTAAYRNPVVDSLFGRAGATVDQDERARLYRRIQEIAVEDLPYVWLVETVSSRAYRRRCTDFGPSGHFAETARCDP